MGGNAQVIVKHYATLCKRLENSWTLVSTVGWGACNQSLADAEEQLYLHQNLRTCSL